MSDNPSSKPEMTDVRIETFFPGDTEPTVKTERRAVRVVGARLEIWSVGQWIAGKYDGDIPVLTVDLRRSTGKIYRNIKLSE